ncbi:MAG TPA: carboxypeptidase-like regulatory domain-containing protein, partial [Chitinophagaceae bacterium]|nr:carboxypeptidase-like regulatory domain-containing protein [Chitinophagaceae bacterium]
MRKQVLVFLLVAISGWAQAQGVKGKLLDLVDNKPLAGATLTLMGLKDTSKIFNSVSDSKGEFLFQNISSDSFFLLVHSIGYEDFKQIIGVKDSILNLGTLLIPKSTLQLGGVTVVGKTSPTVQKGDTTQYSASQFKVNPDATVEDLVKKMPGITVDKEGTVTAQGEQVRKVTIDGRDFFGDDATAALRNLPSEIVDKIQVFDKLSEQAQLTGVDDGNSQKAINIITRAGMRNGQFGRLFAGIGTDNRYQAGGNASFFKD